MDTDLAALAAAYGVATEFWDQAGQHHAVPAETVVAVLAALGVDATGRAGIASALHERRMRDWRKALPPVFVVRQGDAATTWVHLPHGDSARLWIELEDGGGRSDVVQVDRCDGCELHAPIIPPPGAAVTNVTKSICACSPTLPNVEP